MKNNSVVITGANGFIGGSLTQSLLDMDIKPILVDSDNSRCPITCTFIHKDVFLERICDLDIDVIMHQGACSDTMNHDRAFMMENNYHYSKRLLDACNSSGIRLIYASSAAVYGMGTVGFSERSILDTPLNVYGESKLMFDEYISQQSNKNQVVGLRYFNVYGSNESHKGRMASVIFHFYNQVKKNNHVRLFEGSENFYRDFIHIDDAISVNLFFMNNPNISGIFNVGTGLERSFLDIAKTIEHLTMCDITFQNFPQQLEGKYQKFTRADVSKLRSTGYDRDFKTLEEGISDYWAQLS